MWKSGARKIDLSLLNLFPIFGILNPESGEPAQDLSQQAAGTPRRVKDNQDSGAQGDGQTAEHFLQCFKAACRRPNDHESGMRDGHFALGYGMPIQAARSVGTGPVARFGTLSAVPRRGQFFRKARFKAQSRHHPDGDSDKQEAPEPLVYNSISSVVSPALASRSRILMSPRQSRPPTRSSPKGPDKAPEGKPAGTVEERRAPFPVVGIGASAGGLEALTALLKALSPDLGMAYIIVPHLDPHRESAFSQILERYTKMPVRQIEQGVAVESNHVYVIPPNCDLKIADSRLHIRDLDQPRVDEYGHRPFLSLPGGKPAQQCHRRGAVGERVGWDGGFDRDQRRGRNHVRAGHRVSQI